ncbi:unnamed protein product [Lactuca saligna]|uniref:TAFII28-like protein domain-containing protein n=1 Tax=Lactuca saligna TaxID=75948 RepID=A0AA35YSS2_LACSI|nr:unnamed protein product [Lactuca saligna]
MYNRGTNLFCYSIPRRCQSWKGFGAGDPICAFEILESRTLKASESNEGFWILGREEKKQGTLDYIFGLMKQSKDPFEVAFEELDESLPDSPDTHDEIMAQTLSSKPNINSQRDDLENSIHPLNQPKSRARLASTSAAITTNQKNKEDDEEEEEENMDVELGKFPSTGDPDKMAKMQSILSQFTEEQMSRYESFRRSGFQKSNMKRLLASITGSAKISMPMTIVVSGIAKIFVGELVETARVVMTERKETGPIRPCHIREAYRRLKLEGKIPKRSVPRLFR